MKWVWIIILGILVSACGGKGKVYQLPLDETRAALVASGPIDMFVMPGKVLERDEAASSDTMIVWSIRDAGAELLRVKAALSAENALATRVNISLEGGHSAEGAAISDALDADGQTRKTYVAAAEEAIAAKIENRNAREDVVKDLILKAAASADQERMQRLLRHDPAKASEATRAHSQMVSDIQSGNYERAGERRHDKLNQYNNSAPTVSLEQYR